MDYLEKSISPQYLLKKMTDNLTEEELIIHIVENAKFFIATDNRCLMKETKEMFNKGKLKFLMVDIKEIEFIKKYRTNIHYLLNKGTEDIQITISLIDFKKSGLYLDHMSAAKDIRVIMDDYEKRQKTYQHNLNQTNKGIAKLLKASEGILDTYPEAFV